MQHLAATLQDLAAPDHLLSVGFAVFYVAFHFFWPIMDRLVERASYDKKLRRSSSREVFGHGLQSDPEIRKEIQEEMRSLLYRPWW